MCFQKKLGWGNKLKHFLNGLVGILLVCSLILLVSCSAPAGEGFAIYLTKEDVSPAKMESLSVSARVS